MLVFDHLLETGSPFDVLGRPNEPQLTSAKQLPCGSLLNSFSCTNAGREQLCYQICSHFSKKGYFHQGSTINKMKLYDWPAAPSTSTIISSAQALLSTHEDPSQCYVHTFD